MLPLVVFRKREAGGGITTSEYVCGPFAWPQLRAPVQRLGSPAATIPVTHLPPRTVPCCWGPLFQVGFPGRSSMVLVQD